MSIVKIEKGITLIALVISIIVVLILTGIVVSISYQTVLGRSESAVTISLEEMLRERVEMALADCGISYIYGKYYEKDLSQVASFKEELKTELKSMIEAENIEFDGNILKFTYKNGEYKFYIAEDKSVSVIYDLKENVRIGDYFEYPIEYIDVYSGKNYTATNGWVVIDDGVTQGTSGTLKLISKGIPAKWYYNMSSYSFNVDALNQLNNNFSQAQLFGNDGMKFYGSVFLNDLANKAKTITLQELNFGYNAITKEKRTMDDTSKLNKMENIFYLEDVHAYYWLANNIDDTNTYYVNMGEILKDSDLRMGIRVVIELKDDLSSAILNSGVWKVIE